MLREPRIDSADACETRNKHPGSLVRSVTIGTVLIVSGLLFAVHAQTSPAGDHAPGAPLAAGEQHGEPASGSTTEKHGEEHAGTTLWSVIARLVNFGLLAGILVYFLRVPLGDYLRSRAAQIRSDLETAAETRRSATARLDDLGRRMEALPGELAALRARVTEEALAEEERIRQVAEAECQRLLDQTRREIDAQLRLAKRELMKEAAELAVGVASERVKRELTENDQARLVDRYVEQVTSLR